jgi:hypothetical protein
MVKNMLARLLLQIAHGIVWDQGRNEQRIQDEADQRIGLLIGGLRGLGRLGTGEF